MPDTAPRSAPPFLLLGALSAGVAVAAGAFGAHALRDRIEPQMLEVFETGARYEMYHALALIVVALLIDRARDERAIRRLRAAGWCFAVGTLLFSGSLYAMALTGHRVLGAITPLGGVAFLAGWGALAFAARIDD